VCVCVCVCVYKAINYRVAGLKSGEAGTVQGTMSTTSKHKTRTVVWCSRAGLWYINCLALSAAQGAFKK